MKALSEPIPKAKLRQTMKAAMVTKCKKLRRRPIRPAIGSLYDIMHDYAGVKLFIRPISWTDLHTKLLNCRFVQLPPHTTPITSLTPASSASSQGSPRMSQTAVSIGSSLETLMADWPITTENAKEQDLAMAVLLSTLYPGCFWDPYCAELDISFGSRCCQGMAGWQLLWNRRDSATTRAADQPIGGTVTYSLASADNGPPILACISRRLTDHSRKNNLKVKNSPNGAPNIPVYMLQSWRLHAMTPKNVDEDPYYLGIMVAMAQKSVYTDTRTATGFTPRDVRVRLIAIAEEDHAFVVYTAVVPRALLCMLHEPDSAPTGNTEVIIEYARVPVWPILGLKERLGKALGSDLVGEYDDTVIDTYKEKGTPAAKADSKKRERQALSEVFNGSFYEGRPYQSFNSSLPARKKRRIKQKNGRPCSVTA